MADGVRHTAKRDAMTKFSRELGVNDENEKHKTVEDRELVHKDIARHRNEKGRRY